MFIRLENVNHIYNPGTPQSVKALEDVNLELPSGRLTVILGETGSGKTTLVQHISLLLKPTSGNIYLDDVEVGNPRDQKSLREKRKKIGFLFQNPYHQLVEDTVIDDIAFGPRKQGLGPKDVEQRVAKAMEAVGLDREISQRSPFFLSGGQVRRVALAGILALEPEVLILDEPLAGLDPRGRKDFLNFLSLLHREKELSIMIVSHALENILPIAQDVIVVERGKVSFKGPPRELLKWKGFHRSGLKLPEITRLMYNLQERGKPVNPDVLTLEEAERELLKRLKEKRYA